MSIESTELAALRIEHADDEGTTIDGTSRGDGTAQVLKATGWRWSRTLGAWYVPRSWNVPPKRGTIARTVEALEAAGLTVAVSIDATPGDREAVEARRVQDAAARADRLDERAQRHEQAAADRYAAARGIADGIPLGQPILVGHHSEGRARRDAARMGAHMDASVEAHRRSSRGPTGGADRGGGTDARNNPVTVANRVDRLAVEVRRVSASSRPSSAAGRCWRTASGPSTRRPGTAAHRDGLEDGGEPQEAAEDAADGRADGREDADGERGAQQLSIAAAHAVRVRERLESDRADLAHWQAVRARQVADRTATDFGRHIVAAGDRVRVRGVWYPVVRANVKTLTVFGMLGPRMTPWQEVQGYQRRADEAQAGAGVDSTRGGTPRPYRWP